jgi:tetraacyldisaccharide-1-P 4'-kinase
VVTALASSNSFVNYLCQSTEIAEHYEYKDHYDFGSIEIKDWISDCQKYKINQIVTTEKDAVKLLNFQELFEEHFIELVVIPIKMKFEKEDELGLKKLVDSIL